MVKMWRRSALIACGDWAEDCCWRRRHAGWLTACLWLWRRGSSEMGCACCSWNLERCGVPLRPFRLPPVNTIILARFHVRLLSCARVSIFNSSPICVALWYKDICHHTIIPIIFHFWPDTENKSNFDAIGLSLSSKRVNFNEVQFV